MNWMTDEAWSVCWLLAFTLLLGWASASDVRSGRVSNVLVGAGLLAGLLLSATPAGVGLLSALAGAAIGLLALMPLYLLPGNHDAALSESVWTRAQRDALVPPNVRLCLRPEPVEIEGRMVVLPAPLTQRHSLSDLTEWFAAAETPAGLPRIGLAHGAVQGILAEDIDSANPIVQDRATRARLDYLALGDWHGTKQIDARTWYAGTPEPDRFKDNDPGNALVVTIDGPGAPPV
ncbi:MAG: hypothetical protein EBS99_05500, partial [Betaproteobacteria bacterium]|nr:hypothetical protein [Betaproteobacteria bacterium]